MSGLKLKLCAMVLSMSKNTIFYGATDHTEGQFCDNTNEHLLDQNLAVTLSGAIKVCFLSSSGNKG